MSTTELAETPDAPATSLPPPTVDYGFVRIELMGHRYREGRLSEVVIAGQPFLRLDLAGGAVEIIRAIERLLHQPRLAGSGAARRDPRTVRRDGR